MIGFLGKSLQYSLITIEQIYIPLSVARQIHTPDSVLAMINEEFNIFLGHDFSGGISPPAYAFTGAGLGKW